MNEKGEEGRVGYELIYRRFADRWIYEKSFCAVSVGDMLYRTPDRQCGHQIRGNLEDFLSGRWPTATPGGQSVRLSVPRGYEDILWKKAYMDDLFLCPECGRFHQPPEDDWREVSRMLSEDWEGFIAKVNSRLTVKEFFYKRCNMVDGWESCEEVRARALKEYAEHKRQLKKKPGFKASEIIQPKAEIVDESPAEPRVFVYLIEGNAHYKIGIATNVPKRKRALQTSSPFDLKLVKCWESASPQKAERYLHERFKSYRLKGEWFRLPIAEVEALLQIPSLDVLLPPADHAG